MDFKNRTLTSNQQASWASFRSKSCVVLRPMTSEWMYRYCSLDPITITQVSQGRQSSGTEGTELLRAQTHSQSSWRKWWYVVTGSVCGLPFVSLLDDHRHSHGFIHHSHSSGFRFHLQNLSLIQFQVWTCFLPRPQTHGAASRAG